MKRTTEAVLLADLAVARREYGAAIERRDQQREKVDAAKRELSVRDGYVTEAKARTDRAVATLEAFTGKPLEPTEKTS